MSFVNLLGNNLWSEYDILRHTEAMIRKEFSIEKEAVINRKATRAAIGSYSLTQEDQNELQEYAKVSEKAGQAGIEAAKDNALLSETLAYEKSKQRLSIPEIEKVFDEQGTLVNKEEVEKDQTERAEALLVANEARSEVIGLYSIRNPEALI